MGRKTTGKKESNKAPKLKSSGGKFEAPKDKTKKSSQKAEEKIEAAIEVLEREKITFKELSKASVDILVGSIERPIYKKIEDLQVSYDSKKQELFGDIIEQSKKINKSIKSVIKKEVEGIEHFEERMNSRFKSEDIEDSMNFRIIKMYGKTYIGSLSARLAKMPYTIAARYQALKGNTKKQDELLFKATRASRKVIEKLRNQNRKYARETEKRTQKFDEVDEATTHYVEREAIIKKAKQAVELYSSENSNGDVKRNISSKISKASEKRIYKANWMAEKVEDLGSFIARRAAIKGHFTIADSVAQKTVEASDFILNSAVQKNNNEYSKTNSIVRGHEAAEKIAADAIDGIEIDDNIARALTNLWGNKRGNTLAAKGIKLANSAITSSTKYLAKGDMKLTSIYAKAVSNLGFSKHGINVLKASEKRTENAMINSAKLNSKIRKSYDRAFGFSEKRLKNTENAINFMEVLKKGIAVGPLKDSKGEFSSWIDDVEARIEQQKVKRKFNRVGKKVGILELIERGAKGVLTRVQGSLTDAREVRAAAQMDLEMNPEKKASRKPTREDRE